MCYVRVRDLSSSEVEMDTTQEQDHEAIASRAYAMFLDREREGVAGDELSDWYAAVRELEGGQQEPLRQEKRGRRQAV
jgi:hypothetical protein